MNPSNERWQIVTTFTLSAELVNEPETPCLLGKVLCDLVLPAETMERLLKVTSEATLAMQQGNDWCIEVRIYCLFPDGSQVTRQLGWSFFLIEKSALRPVAPDSMFANQVQSQLDIYLYPEQPRG